MTPLPLWTAVLAGPIVWAINLTASYALVKWVCRTNSVAVFPAITFASLAAVAGAAALAWTALKRTSEREPTDGGRPRQRARFMAILALALCALFALQIVAGAIPYWVIDACQ